MTGDVKRDVPWWQSRYLSEHWGRTMAAQDRMAVDDYRMRIEAGIRDLLAQEKFGPRSVLGLIASIASDRNMDVTDKADRASKNRAYRLKQNGGCPVCADAETPNPDGHRDFHDRMTRFRATPEPDQ